MKIIGISGYAQSGKDTTADIICQQLRRCDIIFNRASFAKGVKQIASEYFNWDGRKDAVGRKLLQDIGMFGRQVDQNTWVRCVQKESLMLRRNNIIITDLRFNNQADWIRKNGGIILKIERDVEIMNHPSEVGINDNYVDLVIYNNGSKDDLRLYIKNYIINYIIKKMKLEEQEI